MSRSNFRVKVGTYTGNSTAREISDMGFQPDIVIIKGVSQYPVFRVKQQPGDDTAYFDINLANITDAITGFTANGFTLGTGATVNGNTVAFYYIAIKGNSSQKYFKTGMFVGDGNDNRNLTTVGMGFTPDFVNIKSLTTVAGAFRTKNNTGDSSGGWGGSFGTNKIQSLISGGFQLGTNSAVNTSGQKYLFWALRELAGVVKFGTYTGDGLATKSISGVGFTPDIVFVKEITGTVAGTMKTLSMPTTTGFLTNNGAVVNDAITSLDADGFTVANSASVNTAASAYIYMAIKSGNFNVPIERLTA